MKNQAKFNAKKTILKSKSINESPEMERRMRLIANLIIDRIFEDKQNNVLVQNNRIPSVGDKRERV